MVLTWSVAAPTGCRNGLLPREFILFSYLFISFPPECLSPLSHGYEIVIAVILLMYLLTRQQHSPSRANLIPGSALRVKSRVFRVSANGNYG